MKDPKTGQFGLHLAVKLGIELAVIQDVIQLNPDALRERDKFGCLPIHYACHQRQTTLETLQYLVSQSPRSLRERDALGQLPIHHLAQHQEDVAFFEYVDRLHGEGVREKDKDGWLPLHYVAKSNASVPVLQFLVLRYAGALRETTTFGSLPIHCAAHYNPSVAVLEYLVAQHPGGLTERGASGMLPIHSAARNNPSLSVLHYLVAKNSEGLTTGDKHGRVPLHHAVRNPHNAAVVVRYLVELYPAMLRHRDTVGWLPFHQAARYSSQPSLARYLAELHPGALQAPDEDGWLPLHHAARANYQNLDVLKLLVDLYPDALLVRNADSAPHELAPAHSDARAYLTLFYVAMQLDGRSACMDVLRVHLLGDVGAGKSVAAHWLKVLLPADALTVDLFDETHDLPWKHGRTQGLELTTSTLRLSDRVTHYLLHDYSGASHHIAHHTHYLHAPDSLYVLVLPLFDRVKRTRNTPAYLCQRLRYWTKLVASRYKAANSSANGNSGSNSGDSGPHFLLLLNAFVSDVKIPTEELNQLKARLLKTLRRQFVVKFACCDYSAQATEGDYYTQGEMNAAHRSSKQSTAGSFQEDAAIAASYAYNAYGNSFTGGSSSTGESTADASTSVSSNAAATSAQQPQQQSVYLVGGEVFVADLRSKFSLHRVAHLLRHSAPLQLSQRIFRQSRLLTYCWEVLNMIDFAAVMQASDVLQMLASAVRSFFTKQPELDALVLQSALKRGICEEVEARLLQHLVAFLVRLERLRLLDVSSFYPDSENDRIIITDATAVSRHIIGALTQQITHRIWQQKSSVDLAQTPRELLSWVRGLPAKTLAQSVPLEKLLVQLGLALPMTTGGVPPAVAQGGGEEESSTWLEEYVGAARCQHDVSDYLYELQERLTSSLTGSHAVVKTATATASASASVSNAFLVKYEDVDEGMDEVVSIASEVSSSEDDSDDDSSDDSSDVTSTSEEDDEEEEDEEDSSDEEETTAAEGAVDDGDGTLEASAKQSKKLKDKDAKKKKKEKKQKDKEKRRKEKQKEKEKKERRRAKKAAKKAAKKEKKRLKKQAKQQQKQLLKEQQRQQKKRQLLVQQQQQQANKSYGNSNALSPAYHGSNQHIQQADAYISAENGGVFFYLHTLSAQSILDASTSLQPPLHHLRPVAQAVRCVSRVFRLDHADTYLLSPGYLQPLITCVCAAIGMQSAVSIYADGLRLLFRHVVEDKDAVATEEAESGSGQAAGLLTQVLLVPHYVPLSQVSAQVALDHSYDQKAANSGVLATAETKNSSTVQKAASVLQSTFSSTFASLTASTSTTANTHTPSSSKKAVRNDAEEDDGEEDEEDEDLDASSGDAENEAEDEEEVLMGFEVHISSQVPVYAKHSSDANSNNNSTPPPHYVDVAWETLTLIRTLITTPQALSASSSAAASTSASITTPSTFSVQHVLGHNRSVHGETSALLFRGLSEYCVHPRACVAHNNSSYYKNYATNGNSNKQQQQQPQKKVLIPVHQAETLWFSSDNQQKNSGASDAVLEAYLGTGLQSQQTRGYSDHTALVLGLSSSSSTNNSNSNSSANSVSIVLNANAGGAVTVQDLARMTLLSAFRTHEVEGKAEGEAEEVFCDEDRRALTSLLLDLMRSRRWQSTSTATNTATASAVSSASSSSASSPGGLWSSSLVAVSRHQVQRIVQEVVYLRRRLLSTPLLRSAATSSSSTKDEGTIDGRDTWDLPLLPVLTKCYTATSVTTAVANPNAASSSKRTSKRDHKETTDKSSEATCFERPDQAWLLTYRLHFFCPICLERCASGFQHTHSNNNSASNTSTTVSSSMTTPPSQPGYLLRVLGTARPVDVSDALISSSSATTSPSPLPQPAVGDNIIEVRPRWDRDVLAALELSLQALETALRVRPRHQQTAEFGALLQDTLDLLLADTVHPEDELSVVQPVVSSDEPSNASTSGNTNNHSGSMAYAYALRRAQRLFRAQQGVFAALHHFATSNASMTTTTDGSSARDVIVDDSREHLRGAAPIPSQQRPHASHGSVGAAEGVSSRDFWVAASRGVRKLLLAANDEHLLHTGLKRVSRAHLGDWVWVCPASAADVQLWQQLKGYGQGSLSGMLGALMLRSGKEDTGKDTASGSNAGNASKESGIGGSGRLYDTASLSSSSGGNAGALAMIAALEDVPSRCAQEYQRRGAASLVLRPAHC